MSDKLLSPAEIEHISKQTVEDIKSQMEIINRNAVKDFYDVNTGASKYPYDRTGGFYNLGKNPEEIKKGDTIELIYKYSASDLTVNEWQSPWGKLYQGEPEWAFDTGFVHGIHGGPTPVGGSWQWLAAESTPIWELIVEGVNSLE